VVVSRKVTRSVLLGFRGNTSILGDITGGDIIPTSLHDGRCDGRSKTEIQTDREREREAENDW
jgi:hypothetical protein